jgi:hypothetical protein
MSVPQEHRPHHDPASATLAGLRRKYGDWEILVHLGNSVVSAERRSGAGGRAVHYIVAHSLEELAAKLATASVAGR